MAVIFLFRLEALNLEGSGAYLTISGSLVKEVLNICTDRLSSSKSYNGLLPIAEVKLDRQFDNRFTEGHDVNIWDHLFVSVGNYAVIDQVNYTIADHLRVKTKVAMV